MTASAWGMRMLATWRAMSSDDTYIVLFALALLNKIKSSRLNLESGIVTLFSVLL
jgi:hypothetical protein